MEHCIRCKISESEVQLFDSVYDGKPSLICERCAIIENLPVIERQRYSQKQPEKQLSVFERMKKIAGLNQEKKQETFILKDKLNQLQETPKEKKLELIEFYHWELMKARRRKGLTQEQLANAIGESALNIDKLERAVMPENTGQIIRKIEQFLHIRLKKTDEREQIAIISKSPVLLDENGNILEHIPEPILEPMPEPEITGPKEKIRKIIVIPKQEQDIIAETEKHPLSFFQGPKLYELPYSRGRIQIQEPANIVQDTPDKSPELDKTIEAAEEPLEVIDVESGDLDVQKAKMTNVKIADLREIYKQKIHITKQERTNEAKKIEERQKLIEARKEEIRSLKEKQSKDIDSRLGGTELLKNKQDYPEIEIDESDVDEDFERFEKE